MSNKIILSFCVLSSTFASIGTVRAATPSVTGANIPAESSIVDSSGATWTLSGAVVYKNGAKAGSTSGVTELIYLAGTIYQENSAGKFWPWTGTTWGAMSADPRVVSASGASIKTAGQLIDASRNVWAVSGAQVYENGKLAGNTSGVALLEYYNGKIYQQNAAGNFYYFNNGSWTATTNPAGGGPTPTPTPSKSVTPTPTPSVTVTSGPAQTGMHVPQFDMEPLNPFPSWANVKTTYGAKGDGATDDSAAFNRALADLGKTGKATVLYVPSGTYVIKSTLSLTTPSPTTGKIGVSVVGEERDSTILKWEGGKSPMIEVTGGFNPSISRLTLNGQEAATFGVLFAWNGSGAYVASPEILDMVFENLVVGVMAGDSTSGQLNSEGQVRRSYFKNISYSGVATGESNALDWWVFDSSFSNCNIGITNNYNGSGTPTNDGSANSGAGAFYVYRSNFSDTKYGDFVVGNAGWFSIHNSVSIGTAPFVRTSANSLGGHSSVIVVEGNRVVTTAANAITGNNPGPLLMFDNQIHSTGTPIAIGGGWQESGTDIDSVGNKYTNATLTTTSPGTSIASGQAARVVSISDSVVSASSISTAALAIPAEPARPAASLRPVIEVASGASEATVQAAINSAAAKATGNVEPIVHLPAGNYVVTSTLSIPAEKRIQIVGDGMTTNIAWQNNSPGSIFTLNGPSYATLRGLTLFGVTGGGTTGAAVSINEADQSGGRIFVEGGSGLGDMTVSNVTQSQIDFQGNTGISGITADNVKNFVAIASGGLGFVNSTGGSNLMIADTWYEGSSSNWFRMDSGTLTMQGARIAPATHSPVVTPVVPAIELNSSTSSFGSTLLNPLNGLASFLGVAFNLEEVPNHVGIEVSKETSGTNGLFMGMVSGYNGMFQRTSSGGSVGLVSSRGGTGSYSNQIPNVGTTDASFILKMLAQVRGLTWDTSAYSAPAGATDVRIYRVTAPQANGMTITGN